LYTEIERLSALWENLDKQVKDKVFDLAVMEERIQKAATEKAKADNKYFATMRQKDAADAERKNLQRNLDKQVKVIEKLAETEKSLGKQIVRPPLLLTAIGWGLTHLQNQMEKEAEIAQRRINEREIMLLNMQQKVEEYRSNFEGERKKTAEVGNTSAPLGAVR
jgi:E3 ubiquitin-protein ligase BRE1